MVEPAPQHHVDAITTGVRHAALLSYARDCWSKASATRDLDERLGLLRDAQAAMARAAQIREGRA